MQHLLVVKLSNGSSLTACIWGSVNLLLAHSQLVQNSVLDVFHEAHQLIVRLKV